MSVTGVHDPPQADRRQYGDQDDVGDGELAPPSFLFVSLAGHGDIVARAYRRSSMTGSATKMRFLCLFVASLSRPTSTN